MSELHHIASISCAWMPDEEWWDTSLTICHPDGLADTPYFEACTELVCELRAIDRLLDLLDLNPSDFWPYMEPLVVTAHLSARQTPVEHHRIDGEWMTRAPHCACQYGLEQQVDECLTDNTEFEEILDRLDTLTNHTLTADIDLEYDGDGCWLAYTLTDWKETNNEPQK